jgi:beta-glucanase (GH16 family)
MRSLWKCWPWGNYDFFTEGTVYKCGNNIFGEQSSIDASHVCKIKSQYYSVLQHGMGWNGADSSSHVVCGALGSVPSFKYGYFEAKFKEPANSVKVTSAFWLLGGADNSANGYTEMEAQEYCSGSNNNSPLPPTSPFPFKQGVVNSIFYAPPNRIHQTSFGNLINSGSDLTNGFHTYGLNWQPNYIDWYFDGVLVNHADYIQFDYQNIPVSDAKFCTTGIIFWTKFDNHGNNLPNGEALEIDYFHYYKRKPILTSADFNSSNNTVTLTVNTGNEEDTYFWSSPSGYVGFNWTNKNVANISLYSGYNGTSVKVSATGINPAATSSSTFTFQQGNGNICSIPAQDNVYIAQDINSPQSGCSSAIVSSGTNVTFIGQSSITLNPGFEVQLGGTFNGLTQ